MNKRQEKRKINYLSYSIPIGAGLGVALGLVLMNVLDHNGMFALGIAIGLALGVTIGLALDWREGGGYVGD